MAKLYRRVHRLPHHGVALALLLGVALSSVGSVSHAQGAAPRGAAPAPSPEAQGAGDVEALLGQLRTDNSAARRRAIEGLNRLEVEDVPAIRARLMAPLGVPSAAVHATMLRAINAVTNGRENAPFVLLDALMQVRPRTPELDVALERVALVRALGRIHSAEAGRVWLAFSAAHDGVFRRECLRVATDLLQDYAVPALIELRRPTDAQRLFARQVREALRRVTPGDTVRTRDNALLAEILRAYGSLRQPDAMNVVASFLNSDRTQVREAARWALTQYGREAINVLRTAYENSEGDDANPAWSHERIARELYGAFDRRRDEEVASALDQGLAAARTRDWATMRARFEWVLARHPLYRRRAEMVEPLRQWATELERRDAAQAESVLRMALRIDPDGPHAAQLQSSVLFLEAERALAHGVADPELYQQALRADPANRRARSQLAAVAQVEVLRARSARRWLAAVGLLALGLAGAGLAIHQSWREARRKARKGPQRPGGGGATKRKGKPKVAPKPAAEDTQPEGTTGALRASQA